MGNCFTNQSSTKPSSVVPVNQVRKKATWWQKLKNCVFQDSSSTSRVDQYKVDKPIGLKLAEDKAPVVPVRPDMALCGT